MESGVICVNKLLDKIARGILRFFRKKNLKYGVNSIIVTLIVIALAVVLNLLVGLPNIKFDLTPGKLYTIGDVTKELLNGLNNDIEVVCLFDELQPPSSYSISASNAQDAMNMLYSYANYPRVKLTFIDPDKNPGFMRELDPDGTLNLSKGNFVVRRGQKSKKLTLNDLFATEMDQQTYETRITGMKAEEAFSGAIKYVSSEWTPIVYFVEGHNEIGISNFSQLKNYLLNNNYLVEPLALVGKGAVPEDAELLVFASPKLDLFPQEIDILADYFKMSGGKAMFMFDYDEYAVDMDNFNRVLGDSANLEINNDKVRSDDDNSHLPDDPYTVFYSSNRNIVFSEPVQLLLNNSRSLTRLMNVKEWITQTTLLSTGEKSFSEPISPTQAGKPGPLDVAVAVVNKGGMKESKIIAIGNGSFITDSAVQMYGPQLYQYNSRMFLYSLRWLLGEQDTLTIQPKVNRTAQLTITERQMTYIALFICVVLPLLIMGAGFAVYLKRRHL